ncbi:hypothetical protein ACO2Q8_04800 [Larkinella sp. VNQ87]|uniref:hypothetical protein n=1 Tax=Larkinella sp. VNQ87 TaxID=3400921 RepID=UPI003BFCCEDF
MTLYSGLLALHSFVRWLVVVAIVLTLLRSFRGWLRQKPYTRADAGLRSAATSLTHLQLLLGFGLYFNSPIVSYFRQDVRQNLRYPELAFFGVYHISLMVIAVVVLTFGSSLGKRAATDTLKHRTVALYFLAGTLLILMAVPWPFSPFVQRPWLRAF